jgi:3',5'-cyclic AMP phosphodiesterase CpdA
MLTRFRNRRERTEPETFLAPNTINGLTYAVGDVHGRHDLLAPLIERILEDAATFDVTPEIVFLGDYVDRGEHTREAVDQLIELSERHDVKTIFLMGNHEQMLLRFLEDPSTGPRWLKFGGLQTLMSYGVGGSGSLRTEGEALQLRDALQEALGAHLDFIKRLRISHHSGNLFFAHAGADPELPTDLQSEATLLWGCDSFRTVERKDGIWVVYGHYVVELPVAKQGRIAVDTGAYFSGRLTAARIAGGTVKFLQG